MLFKEIDIMLPRVDRSYLANLLDGILADPDIAEVERERDAALDEVQMLKEHMGRIRDAVTVQMATTGLPRGIVAVVRGVSQQTRLTEGRISELERTCREQQARAEAAETQVASLLLVAEMSHEDS